MVPFFTNRYRAEGDQRALHILAVFRQIIVQRRPDDGKYHFVDGAAAGLADGFHLVQRKGAHSGGAGTPFEWAIHASG